MLESDVDKASATDAENGEETDADKESGEEDENSMEEDSETGDTLP